MEWKDPRITLWNLKNDTTLNTLTGNEKSQIWNPTLMFFNTEKKSRTINDKSTFAIKINLHPIRTKELSGPSLSNKSWME